MSFKKMKLLFAALVFFTISLISYNAIALERDVCKDCGNRDNCLYGNGFPDSGYFHCFLSAGPSGEVHCFVKDWCGI